MMGERVNFFLAGESGMGIVSSGEILINALAQMGYWINAHREFPSLIKGGQAAYKISFSNERIRGGSDRFDFGICLGKTGLTYGLTHLEEGGVLIHDFERREERNPDLPSEASAKGIELIYVPTREIIHDLGVHTIFENTVVLGTTAKTIGLPYKYIQEALQEAYGKKKSLRDINKRCLKLGFETINQTYKQLPGVTEPDEERMIIDGNTALALGAIHAGVRTYYAYPMSPSTSMLHYFAQTAEKTGIIVKQAEDEITAIQMNIGSSYAGTRALTATSGGGFDLMTESVSLAAMIEVPLVVVIAQRPGPATGLPTRSAQADLNLAIHAGHGEFARIVVAASDQESAFELIQEAYTYAEKYQVPVICLTEKAIAENHQTIPALQQTTEEISRGLVTDPKELKELSSSDRYKITESGVSPRRLPGTSETTYFANGDEHKPDGTLDESPATSEMIAKRVRKLDAIKDDLPDPVIYGKPDSADYSFIGWGSTKGPMLDLIATYREQGIDVNYLHFDWLWPLKTEVLREFIDTNKHICIAENNATGQLANLIHQELCIPLPNRLLKWNGRPIIYEDIEEYIQEYKESNTQT